MKFKLQFSFDLGDVVLLFLAENLILGDRCFRFLLVLFSGIANGYRSYSHFFRLLCTR